MGVMPLGSIMNVARTLSILREVDGAASVIAAVMVLAMDVGRHDGRCAQGPVHVDGTTRTRRLSVYLRMLGQPVPRR